MTRARARLLIALTGVIVLAGAVLTTFGVAGCSGAAVQAADRKTPGVYIVSIGSFGPGFESAVRDINPFCD